MRAALGLRLRLVFLLKHEDARVGLTGYFGHHQQVVATEALCGFGVRVAMERNPGVLASYRGQLELLNCVSRASEGSPRCTSSGRLK